MSAFAHLRRDITGELITPDDLRYDGCRAIFNGMIDTRPAVIVRPRTVEDVAASVRFARDEGHELAIRSGGHNVAGLALSEGIVVDFRDMRAISVDPRTRRAIVQPGATWGQYDAEAQRYGLATTGGIISDTGVAGLALGGGLGWLMGKYGLSCDNMRSCQVVLADGSIVEANDNSEPALMWALRGGGGNFGAVTSFEFALHPVAGVYAGSLVYPLSHALEACERFVRVGNVAPDELTMSLVLMTNNLGQRVVSVDPCYLGSAAAGAEATSGLVPNNAEAVLLSDSRRFQDYVDWQQAFDDPYRRGRRSFWKSIYIENMTEEFFRLIASAIAEAPSPHSMLTFDHVHGAATRIPIADTAFAHRDKQYLFLINTNWNDPADDKVNIDWTRDLFAEVSPFGRGSAYVNYLSNEGADRVRAAYSEETYARLATVKRQVDPENLFNHNQNILVG